MAPSRETCKAEVGKWLLHAHASKEVRDSRRTASSARHLTGVESTSCAFQREYPSAGKADRLCLQSQAINGPASGRGVARADGL